MNDFCKTPYKMDGDRRYYVIEAMQRIYQSSSFFKIGARRDQRTMPPVLSPEFSLAAACAVWPPSRRRTEVIHTAAAKPLDWARFMRVVKRHGVLGLVRDGLKHAQPDIPAEIAREIDEQAVLIVRNTLAMAAEAVRLQRLFDDAGLPLLFLKGASLAMLAYGNLGLRSAKDIDLLVPPETLEPAIALIKRAGYRRLIQPPPSLKSSNKC